MRENNLSIPAQRPLLMGILNLTPDSFYDGGRYRQTDEISRRISYMIEDGADIIDVGAESSRPGAAALTAAEELKRLEPVLNMVSEYPVPFSIDTWKTETAEAALKAGFSMINDITGGGTEGEMFRLAFEYDVPMVIMHMKGNPRTMQKNPEYGDVIAEIRSYFENRIAIARAAGLRDKQLILDPGIGFGKRVEDNDRILMGIHELKSLGFPVLIGASRKSFLSIDNDEPEDRLAASISALTIAVQNGADFMRVHDVKDSRKCIKLIARLNK